MNGIIRRNGPRQRDRRRISRATRPRPVAPVAITDAVDSGAVLTITFDQPISLTGTPAYTTNVVGLVAQSAVQTAANKVAVTFSGPLSGSGSLLIPFRDPAIRGASGGYVTSNRWDFA